MRKSFIQIGLVASLLAGTAVIEAIVPLLADSEQTPEYGYITNSRDYGTLKGWQKCVAKGDGDTDLAQREHCTQHLAKLYEGPPIDVEVTGFMPGSACTQRHHGRLTRAVQAVVTNRSSNAHFFSLEVDAENDAADTVGGSGRIDIQLAPGASKEICFTAFAFENTDKLQGFLPLEHLSEFEVRHASGIEEAPEKQGKLFARLFQH
ncbi:hypothetical protein [Kordiimonas sp.]|uniref:hypothetical protein n=1 Tax=Kordiimonas sp. TaxID=1970157 RepID=UPI003A8FD4AF